jgi:Domain of unknown function (DUF2828)
MKPCDWHSQTRTTSTPNIETMKTQSGNNQGSSAFRDAIDDTMLNKRRGENGNPEYTDRGVGSDVLALSQMVREGDPNPLVSAILARGDSNEVADLMVLLFVVRNCRGGKGEKKLAYDMFLKIWAKYPETCKDLLSLFPHYGYWKDLLLLMVQAQNDPTFAGKEALITVAIDLMKEQFRKDLKSIERYKVKLSDAADEATIEELKRVGPGISLLGKWLPREGTAFDKSIGFADRFLGTRTSGNEDAWQSAAKAKYRRQVTMLTSYSALPEVLLAAKREDEICFGKVASRATMLLRKAFMNQKKDGSVRSNDPKRIRLASRFMTHVVEKGLKGGQLMPHEIVAKILRNPNMSEEEELVYDAQWKNLWRNVVEQVAAKAAEEGAEFVPSHMVPLCDVSGSMRGVPMHVAIALSIGISEITHDAFKDTILTFETQPRWHRLNSTDSIVKKVRSLASAPWGCSTNFEAAYDLILQVVESARLERHEMPSFIVFSDMQFNEAASLPAASMSTMHDAIRCKVGQMAVRLGWEDSTPTPIIYWNLRNTGGHPVDKDTEGAVLLSGFSPSLLKLVIHGEALREEEILVVQQDGSTVTEKVRVTPEDLLRKMLDDGLYDAVRARLVESQEGSLIEYVNPLEGEVVHRDDCEDGDFALV